MNSPALFSSLLLTTSVVLAQSPLRIAGFDTTPLAWVQNIEDGDAAVRYDELAGEHTILFVHTTVDETEAGPLVAAGVISALPFMVSPIHSNWQLTAPELAAMSGYTFSGEQPMIPPRRLANHIATFVGTSYGSGYGTNNPATTGFLTQTTTNGMVATPTLNEDERRAWANSVWTWQESINEYSFNTAMLGRESVFQAAYEYANLIPTLPPLDDAALTALGTLLDSKLGFEMYIQAAHIKPPATATSPIQVRLSRHARIRRRSLQQTTLGWTSPERYVPHPSNVHTNIWLAPLGDEMHIIFPTEVGTLANPTLIRAWVPTSNGLVAVAQTPNPILFGEVVRPEVGIFQCPPDTIAGTAYFERLDNLGVPFEPLGHFERGAFIWPFTPPPEPPPISNGGSNPQPAQ